MCEILADRKVLQSFAHKLAGLCVRWHRGNQNVARIIGVGSRFVFSMAFLLSLNGYPDPVMSKQTI